MRRPRYKPLRASPGIARSASAAMHLLCHVRAQRYLSQVSCLRCPRRWLPVPTGEDLPRTPPSVAPHVSVPSTFCVPNLPRIPCPSVLLPLSAIYHPYSFVLTTDFLHYFFTRPISCYAAEFRCKHNVRIPCYTLFANLKGHPL
jgi:hypothetical protein